MSDKFTSVGFAELAVEMVGYEATVYDKIKELVNWKRIENKLNKKYKKRASADGRPAYPAIIMFKVLLLQRLHNLSDPQMEKEMRDKISFMRFTGLSISSPKPDHSTICRFRQTLLELNLYEKLFSKDKPSA